MRSASDRAPLRGGGLVTVHARFAAVPALILVAASVPAFFTGRGTGARAATAPVSPARAHQVFLSDCAVCHGADGRGTNRGPTLISVGRASVDYELSTGRMPLDPVTGPDQQPHRQASKYSPALRRLLVDEVAGLTPETASPGPDIPAVSVATAEQAHGGEIYRLNCAACHASAGDGGALLHREAPSLHRATPVQIAEAVRVGPGLMPAFGTAAINDSDLDALTAYVRYLGHPRDRGGLSLSHLGPVAEGFVAWAVGIALLIVATRWIGERG